MMSRPRTAMAILLTGLLLPSLAIARPDETPKPKKTFDPNEMICTRDPDLGSRLTTHKVCMTRAQRAQRAAEDRQTVQRAQTSSCQPGAGC